MTCESDSMHIAVYIFDAPHLVDVGRESETEGICCDGLARFETGGTECQIHLNFISILAEEGRLLGQVPL